MAQTDNEIKYIYQLPYKEERELCSILDLNDRWEELGGQYMGYTVMELYDIKRVEKCGESPTRRMFQLWGQKNNKILKLYYYLYQMQHYQAMTVLEPFVPKEYHILEQDTEITRAFKALEQSTPSFQTPSSFSNSNEIGSSQQMHEISHQSSLSKSRENSEAIGTDAENHYIDHNLNSSSRSSNKQFGIQANTVEKLNKVPNSLLQPLQSLDIGHPSNDNKNRTALSPSKTACSRHFGKSKVLTSTSCEDNNCSNCQKKINITEGQDFSREYRQKALEKFPNLIPSEKIATTQAPATVQILSNKTTDPAIQNAPSHPKKTQSSRSDTSVLSDCGVPMIAFEELNLATDSFSNKNLLGKGGFGSVYKGTWKLSQVAVKKINLEAETVLGTVELEINQSLDELRYLQSFRHKNILQVFAFSADPGNPTCLVYEFMENGSLEDRLQCRKKLGESKRSSFDEPLCWETRLKVGLGTASALQYLHTVRDKPIIHGDVKSANILLEKDLEPKLGDFGLAREGPNSHYTSVKVSRVNGTRAYIPNEYLRDRKLSTKVDTYSFGVVLFEICSGLRAYDDKRKPPYLKAYIEEAADIRSLADTKAGNLGGKLVFESLLELGKQCTNEKHNRRPDMISVYKQIGAIENTLKEQKRRMSEEQNTSPVMPIPHPSYMYPSALPPPNSPYSGSYVSSYAGGPSPYSASYTPFAASPRSNYAQFVMRPVQIIPQPYHIPMPPPNAGMQNMKVAQRKEDVCPSPATSPPVIHEESDEISVPSMRDENSQSNSDSNFLPLLTDIGKKSSFLD